MSDNLKLSSFPTAQNPCVGSPVKKFTVNNLIYGTNTLGARQLFLLFVIHLLSVLCISVITTVVTAHIMGLTSKGTEGLNSNNGTFDHTYSPIHIDKQKYISTKGNPEGHIGDNGMSGKKGADGLNDLDGTKGHIGDKGLIGNKGPVGDKGEDGLNGLNGTMGHTGNKGPIGNKGPVGDKGEVGDTGLTGDKGRSGSKGPEGDKGQAGDKCSAGEKGDVGEKGGKVDIKSIGQKGEKGSRGESAVDRTCAGGWMSFGKYCYYFGYSKKTWQNAQKDCKRRSSNLVKIENVMENWFLKSFSSGEKLSRAWIGANDLNREGHMEWVSDKTSVRGGFSNWVPGEPNNKNRREHCAQLYSSQSYKWNDAICGEINAYFCKK